MSKILDFNLPSTEYGNPSEFTMPAQVYLPPEPVPLALQIMMNEPDPDLRKSRESLEELVRQNAELLNKQQQQIEENIVAEKKSARLAWIAIIASVVMTILSIGASVLISIYL